MPFQMFLSIKNQSKSERGRCIITTLTKKNKLNTSTDGPYILYADGEISLEVVEVLCQLIAVVIVGEQALEERQQLRGTTTAR